jgi:hypothetical protein
LMRGLHWFFLAHSCAASMQMDLMAIDNALH